MKNNLKGILITLVLLAIAIGTFILYRNQVQLGREIKLTINQEIFALEDASESWGKSAKAHENKIKVGIQENGLRADDQILLNNFYKTEAIFRSLNKSVSIYIDSSNTPPDNEEIKLIFKMEGELIDQMSLSYGYAVLANPDISKRSTFMNMIKKCQREAGIRIEKEDRLLKQNHKLYLGIKKAELNELWHTYTNEYQIIVTSIIEKRYIDSLKRI